MARTDLHTTRLLGFTDLNIDSVTGLYLGLFGTQPTVRHVSSVTPNILDFMARSGLVIDEDIRPYRSAEEAEQAARALIKAGYRMMSPYPLPTQTCPDTSSIVPSALYYRLNDKTKLGDLVDREHLAPRKILTRGQPVQPPVYLKAGGAAVTGWGYAVRYCETAEDVDAAYTWFKHIDADEHLIAEEAQNVVSCWCAHVVCSDKETRYAGATEQVFSAPGKQSGNVIDEQNLLPEAGIEVVKSAGERARNMGFRGIAALDVGVTEDQRCVAFDPNFRSNASTSQAFLHSRAVEETNCTVSRSATGKCGLPMQEIISRLEGPVSERWFVPTRLLDAALLPAAEGASIWGGFVLGRNREDSERRASAIAQLLEH